MEHLLMPDEVWLGGDVVDRPGLPLLRHKALLRSVMPACWRHPARVDRQPTPPHGGTEAG